MSYAALETAIEAAWEARDGISPATKGETREAIEATLDALDLPTPDQGTQRRTARLMVSGRTEGSAIPHRGGTAIGVVQMFGTATLVNRWGMARALEG